MTEAVKTVKQKQAPLCKGMDFLCPSQWQVRRSVCVISGMYKHSSHQAHFPPFKHIKTSLQLQHFCASPELLQMPVWKGYKGLWNGLSPLCTKRWPGFLHIIFSCCDRTTGAFLCKLWRRRSGTKWWFWGQGSSPCLPWPDGEVAAHFLHSNV